MPARAGRASPVERPAPSSTRLVPFPADGGRARPRAAGRRRLGIRAEMGRLPRRARERLGGELRLWSRNGRPLLRYFPELRPLGELLPPRSALDGEIVIDTRRRARLRRDADAPPSRGEPDQQALGRDPGAVRRLRRAGLGGRRALAASRSPSAATALERDAAALRPLAVARRPRTRRSRGSTSSSRSGSTASSRSASTAPSSPAAAARSSR